jgi:hypothetical protein
MAIVSAIVPWLGQLLMGQTKKAIAMFFASFIAAPISITVGVLIWICAPIDAYRIAKKLKCGKPVGEWEFF